MGTRKALKEEIANRMIKAAETAAESIQGKSPSRVPKEFVLSDKLNSVLDQLRSENESVSLRIYKQNEVTKEFGAFSQHYPVDPGELKGTSLQMVCKNEGGRGYYKVAVVLPNGVEETFGPFFVWGAVSYDAPLKEREAAAAGQAGNHPLIPDSLGGSFASAQQAQHAQALAAQFGGPTFAVESGKFFSKTTDSLLKNQSAQDDKFITLLMASQHQQAAAAQQMNQQQAAAAQQMNQMLTTMFGGMMQMQAAKGGGESDTVKALEAKIDRMEQQRRDDEKFALLQKAADDKFQMLAKQIEDGKKPKDEDKGLAAIVQAFGMVGQLNQANNQMQMKVMEQLTNKSGEQDFLLKMSAQMMNASMQQVDMVQKLAEAGLLGEQGPGLKDYLKQAIGAGAQIVKAMVANSAGGQQAQQLEAGHGMGYLPPGEEDDGEYEEEPEQAQPQVVPQAEPQAAPQAQPAPQAAAQGVGDLLTKDELNLVERDSALAKVVALVTGGGSIPEASQRVFIHARSQNKVALKWLSNPVAITAQVMLHFGATEDRIDEACHDILSYIQHINAGGNPEEWAGTKYRSKRPPYRAQPYDSVSAISKPVATVQVEAPVPGPETTEAEFVEPQTEVVR